MSSQNINQFVYRNWGLKFDLESYDMSLTSDERGYNEEVVFSPYLIAQTYGDRLPFYFDINNPLTAQPLNLYYKQYNYNNIFVSQNYYNPKNFDLSCFTASSSCDIGLTGIDNGLVTKMTGETIYFTNGLFDDSLKFDRYHFDRRLKLFQVTSNASDFPNISFFIDKVLYEVVSKENPFIGRYHELYGGFYQGFYKLFGYDYDIFPERMNKGWSVEMIIKPRLVDEYFPSYNETTLNELYPENKNIFFYIGTRAENKFYHHADGTPDCATGYTRFTSPLSGVSTCACCDRTIENSRCVYIYPRRSKNGKHDPHVNYGCDKCNGKKEISITCGCGCYDSVCETCGWECQYHECSTIIEPTPTPTPSPTSSPSECIVPPPCTPSCTTCVTCYDCLDCTPTGFTSVENTCEKDPLWDSLSNALSFKLCGDPRNPKIGVKVLRYTGGCETTGSCSTTGITYETGYTITEYCSPTPIYPECESINPVYLDIEHWFQFNAVWERYTWMDDCDLWYRGGLGDITQRVYLESLANNSIALVRPPYTRPNADPAEEIELVNLNEKWLLNKDYRKGRLKIYINGRLFWTIEDFEEIIPRALNTDKEKQVGVPFNISWGGGTQGLRENLTFLGYSVWKYDVGDTMTNISYKDLFGDSKTIANLQNTSGTFSAYWNDNPTFTNPSPTNILTLITREEVLYTGPYIQDPECFPINDLTGTTYENLKTNILLEQNFGGTFEGAISQFRMYISPLSAPEVKHNFKLSVSQFQMFNPDCPDCNTTFCLNDDFSYDIFNHESLNNVLGRIYVPDNRDLNYLIEKKLTIKQTKKTSQYWENVWWGNQGDTPQCVGYAWAHWIEDGPVKHIGKKPVISPTLIYKEAQKIDEWPGENYAGTSVRAGAKYLKNTNKIESYLWTYNINTLINTVLNVGPVVVGTNWYYNMFFPDRKTAIIRIGGRLAGGHAYMINGIDINKKLFRIKNSWGQKWGASGHAYISFNDMEKLIKQNGEVCLAIEKNF